MFIKRIRIRNFKSLRDVQIEPEGLATLVGPNGAGKTNFTHAIRFLAEVCQHGLETAVARAGGIENIALRKVRRSTSPISFEVEVLFDVEEVAGRGVLSAAEARLFPHLVLRHSFGFQTAGEGIRAEFVVAHETFSISVLPDAGTPSPLPETTLYTVVRDPDGEVTGEIEETQQAQTEALFAIAKKLLWLGSPLERGRTAHMGKQELLLNSMFGDPYMRFLATSLTRVGVFHFTSDRLRDSGTPTPNPVLTPPGGNLPALVDWLQRKHKREWESILNAMRDIIPGLEDILIHYLPTKTLGLFFVEKGFGRPWRVDEVSDGTIHALSMLVATADPRVSAVVIEEPENSVHPWIVRELGKRLRALAEKKTVIVTTHSPVFIDLVLPSEAWVVSRQKGCTSIRRLTELDSRIEEEWREGNTGLSEYFDAGMLPRAVPGGGL